MLPLGYPGYEFVSVYSKNILDTLITYPSAANSDIEDEVHWTMAQSIPDSLVVDSRTRDLMELLSIHEPGDGLISPTALGAVELNSPSMPILIWDTDSSTDAGAFVANATRVNITVRSSVSGQLAVDSLHDIKLATRWPATAVTEDVSEHPKGRPNSLFVVGRARAKSEVGLGSCDLACLGGEDIFAFNTARGPALEG